MVPKASVQQFAANCEFFLRHIATEAQIPLLFVEVVVHLQREMKWSS